MVYWRGKRKGVYKGGYRKKIIYRKSYPMYRGVGRISKMDKISLQKSTIRVKYNINIGFDFANGASHATVLLPVLTGYPNAEGGGTTIRRYPPLVVINNLYQNYAALYDEMQLVWINLKSAMFTFPTNNIAARLHALLDRKVGGTELPSNGFPIGSNVANNQGTISRLLNSNQNANIGFFSRQVGLEERTTWFDSTLALNQLQIPPNAFNYYGIKADSGRGYMPAYILNLELTSGVTSAGSVTISLALEAKFRFRNPKTITTINQTTVNPNMSEIDYSVIE